MKTNWNQTTQLNRQQKLIKKGLNRYDGKSIDRQSTIDAILTSLAAKNISSKAIANSLGVTRRRVLKAKISRAEFDVLVVTEMEKLRNKSHSVKEDVKPNSDDGTSSNDDDSTDDFSSFDECQSDISHDFDQSSSDTDVSDCEKAPVFLLL